MIHIKQLVVGAIEANCYLIIDQDSRACMIVDPGEEADKIKGSISDLNVNPLAILLTHTHYDHIGALEDIRNHYKIPVYVGEEEQSWLGDPYYNLSSKSGHPFTCKPAEYTFDTDEWLEIESFKFKVVHTPGHSPGGVSFIFPDDRFVITGDALFAGSVGRTDLPGSEPEKQKPAIRQQLFTLPEDYVIFPGHRGSSTIGHEIKTNPFFQ